MTAATDTPVLSIELRFSDGATAVKIWYAGDEAPDIDDPPEWLEHVAEMHVPQAPVTLCGNVRLGHEDDAWKWIDASREGLDRARARRAGAVAFMASALAIGQVWRHKRQRYREIEITALREHDGAAYVRRNTSRRTQAISESTLRRDYDLVDP